MLVRSASGAFKRTFASFSSNRMTSIPVLHPVNVSVGPPRGTGQYIYCTIVYNILFARFRNIDECDYLVKLIFINNCILVTPGLATAVKLAGSRSNSKCIISIAIMVMVNHCNCRFGAVSMFRIQFFAIILGFNNYEEFHFFVCFEKIYLNF